MSASTESGSVVERVVSLKTRKDEKKNKVRKKRVRSTTTAQRILESCVRLFNRYGVDNVSTLKLCAELGISPGHLTHFFPTRAHIEDALVAQLERTILDDIRAFRAHADPPDELVKVLFDIFESLWANRFLLYAGTQKQSALNEAFRRLSETAVRTMEQEFKLSQLEKSLHPLPKPITHRLLAETVWAIWVASLQSAGGDSDDASARRTAIRNCALRHFAVMVQYSKSEEWARGFHKTIVKRIGPAD